MLHILDEGGVSRQRVEAPVTALKCDESGMGCGVGLDMSWGATGGSLGGRRPLCSAAGESAIRLSGPCCSFGWALCAFALLRRVNELCMSCE